MSGPSAPPPADLPQLSRTTSVHLPPPSRPSIRCFDENTDDGIKSYLADEIGHPNGGLDDGIESYLADEIRHPNGGLGLPTDDPLAAEDDPVSEDSLSDADYLALAEDDPVSEDSLSDEDYLALAEEDPVYGEDYEIPDTRVFEDSYFGQDDQVEISVGDSDVIPQEDEVRPTDEEKIAEGEEDEVPLQDGENLKTWESFEDFFFGDDDETLSSKVSFQFSAEEDVIAMGITVGGKETFLRETSFQGGLEAEADQGGLEAEADHGGLEAEADQGGLEAEADQGGPEVADSDVEKKRYGSRKWGGYEIGGERLKFKFGTFRSKRTDKYKKGLRSHHSRKPDQEVKRNMRNARAQVTERLHLEAEATHLESM